MSYADNPIVFIAALSLACMLGMYLFRLQAQRLLEQFFRVFQKLFRLLSKICVKAEQRVRLRHYEVTKALVDELAQRKIERCYGHIEATIHKNMAYYKTISSDVGQQLETLEKDYQDSAQIPPPSPEWVAAVEAIANIEGEERNSDVMMKILTDMHDTVQLHQQDTMREHRWSVSSRHKTLAALEPRWRKLGGIVAGADRKNDQLQHKLRRLDQEMCRYELLTSGNGQGFMASVFARFAVALMLMSLAIMAGIFNTQLLVSPLELVLSEGANLTQTVLIIFNVVIVMSAVMLCESLQLTHMLPLISGSDKRVKKAVAILSVISLFVFGVLSAVLAGAWLLPESGAIAGEAAMTPAAQWTLSLISMGACAVFSLVVIPMEYAVQTFRPVASAFLQFTLHLMSGVFRIFALLSVEIGRLVMRIYDAAIFVPLKVEAVLKNKKEVANKCKTPSLDVREPATMTFNEEEIDSSNVTQIDFSGGQR